MAEVYIGTLTVANIGGLGAAFGMSTSVSVGLVDPVNWDNKGIYLALCRLTSPPDTDLLVLSFGRSGNEQYDGVDQISWTIGTLDPVTLTWSDTYNAYVRPNSTTEREYLANEDGNTIASRMEQVEEGGGEEGGGDQDTLENPVPTITVPQTKYVLG